MTPLPCPFCGETSGAVAQTSTFRWRAWICGCGVVGPEIRIQTMGDGTPEEWEAAASIHAIEAWNTRITVTVSGDSASGVQEGQ